MWPPSTRSYSQILWKRSEKVSWYQTPGSNSQYNTNRILLNSDNVTDFTISGNYITLTKANGTTKQVYIDPLTIGHQISVSSTAPTDLIEGGVWFIIES